MVLNLEVGNQSQPVVLALLTSISSTTSCQTFIVVAKVEVAALVVERELALKRLAIEQEQVILKLSFLSFPWRVVILAILLVP